MKKRRENKKRKANLTNGVRDKGHEHRRQADGSYARDDLFIS